MTDKDERVIKIADIIENLVREVINHSFIKGDELRWHYEHTAKQIFELITKEKDYESSQT